MTTYVETAITQVTVQGGPRGPAGVPGPAGTVGAPGWSPQFSLTADDGGYVFGVASWSGGTGTMPPIGYFKSDGTLTSDITQAAHISSQALIQALVDEANAAAIAASGSATASGLFAAAAQALLAGHLFTSLSDPAIASLPDTPPYGTPFVLQGTSGGNLFGELYRRISGGNVDQGLGISSFAQIAAILQQMPILLQLTSRLTSFLNPNSNIVPVSLVGTPPVMRVYEYFKKQADGSFLHWHPDFSPRVSNLEKSTGMPISPLVPGLFGRVLLGADGGVLAGRRSDDGFYDAKPLPKVIGSFQKGADGARSVWLAGDGIAPFCVSNQFPGDNVIIDRRSDGVRWLNIPPSGLPSHKWVTFQGSNLPFNTFAPTVRRLILLLLMGQSTANGTTAIPPLTNTCPNPGFLVMPNVTWFGGTPRGTRVLGNDMGPTRPKMVLPWWRLKQLVPLHESSEGGNGETQAAMAAYELQKLRGNTVAVSACTTAIGSQSYGNIGPGPASYTSPTVPYQNSLLVVQQHYLIAKLNNLEFEVIAVWPQHEGNTTDSKDTFYGHYQEFQRQFSIDCAAITNGEVTNVLFVTNGFTNSSGENQTHTDQSLAQLQFALDFPTKGVYATPCFVFARNVTDGVHFINTSQTHDGAYIGRAAGLATTGGDALPLYTTGVQIVGNTIVGSVHLPPGAVALTKISPFVTDPGNLGFDLRRHDNGAAVPFTIDVVAGQWVMTVPSRPSGVLLDLATGGYYGTAGAHGGPTTGARCPINDGGTYTNFYGQVMPNHLAVQTFQVTFP